MAARKKVLLVTLEPIARSMAGPAIRSVEIGRQLALRHDVFIFSPHPIDDADKRAVMDGADESVNLCCGLSRGELMELASRCQVLFLQANVLKAFPRLKELGKYLIVDLYDPFLLSVLAQYDDEATRNSSYSLMHKVLEQHMQLGDFFVCASEKQLDYWLGRFCALGRLTPDVYRFDPSFRRLLDVVPFGLPDTPPVRTGPGVKGVVDGIGREDFLLLWGGGIWDWFDPLTPIRAVSALSSRYPQLKLYFMGFKSPNPQVPLMGMALKAQALARDLDTLNRSVFFSDSWTPYQERVNVLFDADVACSAHFDLPETRFSFRTRILDYLWAGRPILTSKGDQFAELISSRGAGLALAYEDERAWENAIEAMINDPAACGSFQRNSQELAGEFCWSRVVEPLLRFLEAPYHLPAFRPVEMPSLFERARAVYFRGGKELLFRRSKEILSDLLRG